MLVDGQPRVSCVTPLRRVAGRSVTTVEGLAPEVATEWSEAFCATGASQCGFCTPGIIVRLEGARAKGARLDDRAEVDRCLAAHLCRCTGWQSIVAAAGRVSRGETSGDDGRDLAAASMRASIEGRAPQTVSPDVALGLGGFADDTAPADASIAVLDADGGAVVATTSVEARRLAKKVQGRRTTVEVAPPLEVAPGDWAMTLRTSWVEPAYLETDAAWCVPGGVAASPLANGGAFGGKVTSSVAAMAESLANGCNGPVRVRWSREDVVRRGPKRPPMAIALAADGSGTVRVVSTDGIVDRIASIDSALAVEQVAVAGPPTSIAPRGAGWVEVAVTQAALRAGEDGRVEVTSPEGAWASAVVVGEGADVAIDIRVRCGRPLDEVVLRSYCVGAAHMALGLVTSEGLAVADDGTVLDLTIRSFGVVRPSEMPHVTVTIEADDAEPVCGSDAVFAAVAAAVWVHQGCPPSWPTGRPLSSVRSRP